MNIERSDQVGWMSEELAAGGRRFPADTTDENMETRRFAPDKDALKDALQVVRALDADSYQALLWALGLTPDRRLSVPGYAQPRRSRDGSPSRVC
jgi:hypothetical protein